jgi:hypothetical protein
MLLGLQPEELAGKMLLHLRKRGDRMFHPTVLRDELRGQNSCEPRYPPEYDKEIGLVFAEAWAWLRAQGLIVPEDDTNGQNGWRRLGRRAPKMENEADLTSYKVGRLLSTRNSTLQDR